MNPNKESSRSAEGRLDATAQSGDTTDMLTAVSWGDYLTTDEAAEYLRVSPSFILRQTSIPYMKGRWNVYAKRDLDAWFDQHKALP